MDNSRLLKKKQDSVQDTISLESCPGGGENCKFLLKHINSMMERANYYILEKDYVKGLEIKDKAFRETVELKQKQCQPCVQFFQKIIHQSISGNIKDLQKMSKGFFAKKKYASQLVRAEQLLNVIEKQF